MQFGKRKNLKGQHTEAFTAAVKIYQHKTASAPFLTQELENSKKDNVNGG